MELFFFTTFGKAFIPKKFRPGLRYFFEKAGYDEVPYHTFGILFWIAAAITYLIYLTQLYRSLSLKGPLVFFVLTIIVWTALMLVVVFIVGGAGYFWLNMRIYRRTKEMEAKLADYLTLVSTSLKGGYSFERALWAAIKPEFGILAREIGLVSKRVMTGNNVTEALREFSRKYESPELRRSIDLIIGELESGGRVVDVIDRTIGNLKKTKALKEEMTAATLTYMIFIGALVMFVMPVLFALSFVLFNTISGFIGNLAGSMSSSPVAMIQLREPGVKASDFKLFSVLTMMIISTSSALIISIIEKGDMRAGVKYIPMFLTSSIIIYFLSLRLLMGIFGGILPS